MRSFDDDLPDLDAMIPKAAPDPAPTLSEEDLIGLVRERQVKTDPNMMHLGKCVRTSVRAFLESCGVAYEHIPPEAMAVFDEIAHTEYIPMDGEERKLFNRNEAVKKMKILNSERGTVGKKDCVACLGRGYSVKVTGDGELVSVMCTCNPKWIKDNGGQK